MTPTILVAEDEADLAATYERMLRRLGEPVTTASTLEQALEVIRSCPLRLVIADLRLPDGDGLDLVRAARHAPGTPPVIVVTGYASEASRRQALDAGATEYVAKPFAIGWFSDLVRKLLGPAGDGPCA
ncbi:MAG: response regulator [Candidatus Rokuibacteriota bacterium]